MTQQKIMYVCEVCADNCPENCGHFERESVRVTASGQWLCNECYDEDADAESPAWHDLPVPPVYAPVGG